VLFVPRSLALEPVIGVVPLVDRFYYFCVYPAGKLLTEPGYRLRQRSNFPKKLGWKFPLPGDPGKDKKILLETGGVGEEVDVFIDCRFSWQGDTSSACIQGGDPRENQIAKGSLYSMEKSRQ
jgi:hypothetical protein